MRLSTDRKEETGQATQPAGGCLPGQKTIGSRMNKAGCLPTASLAWRAQAAVLTRRTASVAQRFAARYIIHNRLPSECLHICLPVPHVA